VDREFLLARPADERVPHYNSKSRSRPIPRQSSICFLVSCWWVLLSLTSVMVT